MKHGAPAVLKDGSYRIADDGLAAGPTLGGDTLAVELLGTGAISAVRAIRTGASLVNGFDVYHYDAEESIRLRRSGGTFVIRPESLIHEYRLHEVDVEKTTFVATDANGLSHCCVALQMRNRGSRAARIVSVGAARLKTRIDDRLEAAVDGANGTLCVWNCGEPASGRALTTSGALRSWSITSDPACIAAERWCGTLDGSVDLDGADPLGALQVETKLEPGASQLLSFAISEMCVAADSPHPARPVCFDAGTALASTRERYEASLERTTLLTPAPKLDLAVRWAKANMLRVMRQSPTGPGFTNDPVHSAACVARDAAWFVHGCDWLDPSFAEGLLNGFARRQEPGGKIVEYYDLRNGATVDYGLNVNDNTALFVLAVWHHAVASGDRSFLARAYDCAHRAAEHLLASRDERGLVWCNAAGTGARGICGWRNIIDGYRISGATTELNSAAFAALDKMAILATMAHDAAGADRYASAAAQLRGAIERHLRNPENGLYYLAIDVDGRPRSEISCDLVFPVMYGVSDEATSARILERLREDDFWTEAGIRTVPRNAPQYDPAGANGLLGGVWVAVSFWYAFAASKFVPDVMAETLVQTFAHCTNDPPATNTVPGEFCEWLHGESLVNRGMMLSPWFPPRYLWAAVEGACGLTPQPGNARIAPNLPAGWNWLAVRNVPWRNRLLSWFVLRQGDRRLYATERVESTLPVEIYERDVTDGIRVEGEAIAHLAFSRRRETLVLIANRATHTAPFALHRTGTIEGLPLRRSYESLAGEWRAAVNADDASIAASVAPGRFTLLEFGDA